MSFKSTTLKRRFCVTVAGVVLTITGAMPNLHAQGLEEIIVTAQRREQSLQEVPISITTVNADAIRALGIRTIEDLDTFSPSVEIQYNLHSPSITIRGMGSNVANMSIEQSAPMFVDGITYGRASMMAAGMVDVERIEVLNGPQPISFGQNATAGAFSVTNRKPTEVWEGNIDTEVGNFGRIAFNGGVGGPINDTWGIRVAGKWDQTSGHLIDAWTGDSFPHRRDAIGRVILQWKPVQNFQALLKTSYMQRKSEGDPNLVCLNPRNALTGQFDETAVLIPGKIPVWDAIYGPTQGLHEPIPDCVKDNFTRVGWREGRESRPRQVFPGYNSSDARSGTFDITDQIYKTMALVGADQTIASREPLHSLDMLLNMTYELGNGISIESNTGMVDYLRKTYEDNETDPFINDSSSRVEKFDMWSQEIRIRSAEGGHQVPGGTLDWETGVYYQIEDLDLEPVATIRPNLSEPMRFYKPAQSPEWKSAFGAITYNFWRDKLSLDIGGRYTDVHKEGSQTSQTATWIFNIDPRIGGVIPSTQHRDPRVGPPVVRNLTIATTATSNTYNANGGIIDCGLPQFRPVTVIRGATPPNGGTASLANPLRPNDTRTASASPCGNYGAGFYTALWLTRDIPDAWDGRAPVGMSPIMDNFSDRPGPFNDTYDSNSFDPQIVLRYRPWESLSVYLKYAEAFKSGGFDTSDRGMPTGGIGTTEDQSGFTYKDEFAENIELGARGDLFDSTVRYGVTVFNQEVKDLQIEATLIDLAAIAAGQDSTGRAQINAGLQRTRGVDFDLTWMINDNFTFSLNGVVQRGRMLDFIAGCTSDEIANAATGDCLTAAESIALVGNANAANYIDRAGSQAPRTPDWKFNVGLDHEAPMPFWGDKFKYYINNKLAFSDGFSINPVTFNRVVGFEKHTIWDINFGFKTLDETWRVDFYGRNLLDERITYNPQYDIVNTQTINGVTATPTPQAWQGAVAGSRDYFSYGVQLSYKFSE